MSAVASQITSLIIVYSTVYSGTDQSKHQSSATLAFVRGIHRSPVNSPLKGPGMRKMFPFDDVIMCMFLPVSSMSCLIHVTAVLYICYTILCYKETFNCSSSLMWYCCCRVDFISLNPLHAKFFRGNINIYLHFMSFIHIDMTRVLKILPQVREGPAYSI